jgi:hypothetical protein
MHTTEKTQRLLYHRKYSKTNDSEMGITYAAWNATCEMVLAMLCKLLELANTSPEVLEFMSNHDIDTAVQRNFGG